jgi:hypothetical protein
MPRLTVYQEVHVSPNGTRTVKPSSWLSNRYWSSSLRMKAPRNLREASNKLRALRSVHLLINYDHGATASKCSGAVKVVKQSDIVSMVCLLAQLKHVVWTAYRRFLAMADCRPCSGTGTPSAEWLGLAKTCPFPCSLANHKNRGEIFFWTAKHGNFDTVQPNWASIEFASWITLVETHTVTTVV